MNDRARDAPQRKVSSEHHLLHVGVALSSPPLRSKFSRRFKEERRGCQQISSVGVDERRRLEAGAAAGDQDPQWLRKAERRRVWSARILRPSIGNGLLRINGWLSAKRLKKCGSTQTVGGDAPQAGWHSENAIANSYTTGFECSAHWATQISDLGRRAVSSWLP